MLLLRPPSPTFEVNGYDKEEIGQYQGGRPHNESPPSESDLVIGAGIDIVYPAMIPWRRKRPPRK